MKTVVTEISTSVDGKIHVKFGEPLIMGARATPLEIAYANEVKRFLAQAIPQIMKKLGGKVEAVRPDKTMGVKVALGADGKIAGETMQLLVGFAQHKDVCDQCAKAYEAKDPKAYCVTGLTILGEISDRPDVSEYRPGEGK